MKWILSSLFLLFFSTASCSTSQIYPKISPEYQGVAEEVKPMVDEFMWLSKHNNIVFTNKVTIGFKKIKVGNIVGVCHFGGYFREIDIDIDFWNTQDHFQRLALVYHELIHCYCGRDHDWAKDKFYPDAEYERINEAIRWRLKGGPRPGRFKDGCPTSLMYPLVVDRDCMGSHYNHYVTEMFNRCDPY